MPESTQPITTSPPEDRAEPEQVIDLKKLAQKVFELLKKETRLERERLGR